MQRSVEALLEAFPYSICQGWEVFHSSELERFCIESGDLFYVHFLQQYMQLLYYCWNNLKTNSLSVHNFQKFLKCCNNPICSVSIGEHDTIEKVMLLQFLDVIFKLMENFGMWTDQKHFGDARHRGGGLYFTLYEFVLHN
jgi:hypothetical protein